MSRRKSITPDASSRPRMSVPAKNLSDDAGDLTLNAAQQMAETTGNDAVLKKLRDAVNARIASIHQRTMMAANMSRTSTGSIRRITSIKQQDIPVDPGPSPVLSPTLAASFDSPLQTASTESTESAKTIKGSAIQTPAASALRTPSYPFPYVPGTPRTWSSSFHRPFTTLSPTVSLGNMREGDSTTETISSGLSTPVASASMFVPPGYGNILEETQGSSYPTPNLYDLVLSLNLDPGLDAWWSTVSKIFQEFYATDRMSLALPADAGELENVPWGQKATFNMTGQPGTNKGASSHHESGTKTSVQSHKSSKLTSRSSPHTRTEQESNTRTTGFTPSRPNLNARHSYGGFESPNVPHQSSHAVTGLHTPISRPNPLRTKSHAPHLLARTESMREIPDVRKNISPVGSSSDRLFPSLSDTDFSTVVSETQSGPYTKVLPVLRALNHETEALLEASSVNRIIERGKLVVLTRDYTEAASRRTTVVRFNEPHDEDSEIHRPTPVPVKSTDVRGQLKPKKPSPGAHGASGKWPLYEDYEQMPSSPWSQSPAPSPAIQADPEHNPFDSMVDEESFSPPEATVDYSHAGAVEAIGVDQANTVIHIPLIHPRVSSNFPFRTKYKEDVKDGLDAGFINEGRASPLKRAPIAILSFSASAVPYPPNLRQSLQLLAPHLATTFEIAQHYTTATTQKEALQQHRTTGYSGGEQPEIFDELADAEIDTTVDSTSLTSPSDYSGRSRQSPGGSIGVNTPGWEHGSLGFSQHGAMGTPGQELVDGYFDARKRSQSTTSHAAQARALDSPEIENDAPNREQWKRTLEEKSRKAPQRTPLESRNRKQHSLLHSYGADFSSTFQSLPSTATPNSHPSLRQLTDLIHEMPPPSERLLRTIVDSLPVQIFTAAPQSGTITWVNSKFIVYRGQETQQVLRDPWFSIHSEDRPAYMEEWQRSLNTGQQFSNKVRLKRFDNAYRWFYVRATPLKDKRQKIVHWAGTYMDIHEQHVAEVHAAKQQETAASEAKYRTLANSSPQIVFVVSRTRGLTFCNSQWTTYSGQSEIEAGGMGFMDAVHPEDLSKCRIPTLNEDGSLRADVPTTIPPGPISPSIAKQDSDASSESSKTVTSPGIDSTEVIPQTRLYQLASTGILKLSRDRDGRLSYSTEIRLRSSDGQYRWHLVRILLAESGASDEDDDEIWYGTCTDIDDHKELEQQLKDAMDAKSRFLSNMSHEIRTPLNGITGMVNFLMDSNLTTEQMEHVNIIRNSTEGLRDLINDILDLSKVEAGMIKLTMEWMHIRSLIEEVNDIMFALAMDKGLELNYSVEDGVPSMVKGDRFRMRQVLLNVVGNAIKFTTTGEVFVRCEAVKDRTGLDPNELFLQFEVIDTGSGFTEKESEFLFKRFSQINKKSQTGTGLGLAISMQLVELHGGKMTASSVPNKGSSFTFTVKCMTPSNEERPLVTASSSTDNTAEISHAAVIPTPKPLNEISQGVRFSIPKIFEDKSPTQTPSPVIPLTASTTSSGSSEPSLNTAGSSIRSQRSSVSSMMSEIAARNSSPINLELPDRVRDSRGRLSSSNSQPSSSESVSTIKQDEYTKAFQKSIFSILVICSLVHTREAIIKHIELTIPKTAPHHITSRSSLGDCQELLLGEDAVRFTHVVIDLPDVEDVLHLMDQLITLPAHANTCIVVVTDIKQRRAIGQCTRFDIEQLNRDRRMRLIFKPLKPSKMAVVFDPKMETELATDQNQHSAQAVAVTQKQIFDELKIRLGNKGFRVLLVDDNKTSQMVSFQMIYLDLRILILMFPEGAC